MRNIVQIGPVVRDLALHVSTGDYIRSSAAIVTAEQIDRLVEEMQRQIDRQFEDATVKAKKISNMEQDKAMTKATSQALAMAAKDIISGNRRKTHGPAERTFTAIAALWSAYLEHPVSEIEVAQMMELLKIARTRYGDPGHADHYIDAAGYACLAGELAGVDLPTIA